MPALLHSRTVWTLGVLLVLTLIYFNVDSEPPSSSIPDHAAPTERIQAVTLDAVRPPAPETLEHVRNLGATHLTLVSFGFQPGHHVPEIRLHNDARWFSESDDGIRTLARQGDSLGLKLILKPHLWIRHDDADGQSRERVGFDTDAKWQQWEAQYRHFLMHYARLAEEVDAPLLVIGTELHNVVRQRPAFWRSLIQEVRSVYSGKLTYAANWYEEFTDVPFWDALDYIGVQAYFPLSESDDPTLDHLKAGWRSHRQALIELSRQHDKPIFFTEIGYRSVPYAAAEPWRWPSRDEQVEPDYELQAQLYQAFFETLWYEPWFAGAIVWKWQTERRRHQTLGFTPQGKPAEKVIRRWFSANSSDLFGKGVRK